MSETTSGRPRIELPNNDTLELREHLAAHLGVAAKTVARMGLPTTYIGNRAYHPHNESLSVIAARINRPKQGRAR